MIEGSDLPASLARLWEAWDLRNLGPGQWSHENCTKRKRCGYLAHGTFRLGPAMAPSRASGLGMPRPPSHSFFRLHQCHPATAYRAVCATTTPRCFSHVRPLPSLALTDLLFSPSQNPHVAMTKAQTATGHRAATTRAQRTCATGLARGRRNRHSRAL